MQGTQTPDPAIAEVKAGLARRGYTQQDLADYLGYSRTAVGNRLNGTVPFNIIELRRVAEFVAVPLDSLLSPASPSPVSAAGDGDLPPFVPEEPTRPSTPADWAAAQEFFEAPEGGVA